MHHITDEEIVNYAEHVWTVGSQELLRLQQTIDRQALVRCVTLIGHCTGRILTAGVGTSGAAAKKIAHSLACIERPAFFLSPGDAVHGALGAAQEGDVAILISKGGGTREIINLIPALHTKNVSIIGVTENENSVLARESQILMKIKIDHEADAFNMLATTSTMAVVAVFDAICIALMYYTNYSKEQFAIIHPGGAVGERLLKSELK